MPDVGAGCRGPAAQTILRDCALPAQSCQQVWSGHEFKGRIPSDGVAESGHFLSPLATFRCKIALPENLMHTQNRFPDSDSASSRGIPSCEEGCVPVLLTRAAVPDTGRC